ncbi:MAG: hypothetical protein ACYTG1_01200 [Planctomycetota bacterium]|jgi:hypothetical protein
MSRFGGEYQVARSTGVCAETGRPLEAGAPCVAALCEREAEEGFERLDFALEAWESGARPPRLFSFWRTTVPEAGQPRRLLVDDEVLVDIFERLADDDRPQRIAFRFVLALILMRKRILRPAGRTTASDGTARWRVRPRGAAPETPPVEVIDPGLGDEDIRELTEQLGEILQAEL